MSGAPTKWIVILFVSGKVLRVMPQTRLFFSRIVVIIEVVCNLFSTLTLYVQSLKIKIVIAFLL